MRTDENLPSYFAAEPGHHRRYVADDFGMEGKLRLFEEEGSGAIEQHPEKPEEPERAIGELLFGLPACMGPPVLVEALEMGNASVVTVQLQPFELRDRHLQGFGDATQPGFLRLLGSPRDLLQEVAPVGISRQA